MSVFHHRAWSAFHFKHFYLEMFSEIIHNTSREKKPVWKLFLQKKCILWIMWRSVKQRIFLSPKAKLMNIRYSRVIYIYVWICSALHHVQCGERSETRRHYSKLMSFTIIINDTAVLKRKNNWLNLFVWGWVNFLGDLNLIWSLFLFTALSYSLALYACVFHTAVSYFVVFLTQQCITKSTYFFLVWRTHLK